MKPTWLRGIRELTRKFSPQEKMRPMRPQSYRAWVECRGAGEQHEMGVDQGRALRQQIRDVRSCVQDVGTFGLAEPRWFSYPLFLRRAPARCQRALVANAPEHSPLCCS